MNRTIVKHVIISIYVHADKLPDADDTNGCMVNKLVVNDLLVNIGPFFGCCEGLASECDQKQE